MLYKVHIYLRFYKGRPPIPTPHHSFVLPPPALPQAKLAQVTDDQYRDRYTEEEHKHTLQHSEHSGERNSQGKSLKTVKQRGRTEGGNKLEMRQVTNRGNIIKKTEAMEI